MKETARSTAGTLTQPAPATSIGTEEVAHDSRGRDQTPLLAHLRAQARANRLANRRLHEAMQALSRDDLHAPRTSFFPSLVSTLNHILAVDVYYLDALHGVAAMAANYDAYVAADTLADLVPRQAASDLRLVAYCDALAADALDAPVAIDRGSHVDHDLPARVLAHLFMHQTHHRGQVHAMLAGTAVKPPQLDEFLLASDAPLRVADLAAVGWNEALLLGSTAAERSPALASDAAA